MAGWGKKAAPLVVIHLLFVGSALGQPADPLTIRQMTRMVGQVLEPLNAVLQPGDAPVPRPKVEFVTRAEFQKLPNPEVDLLVRARLPEFSGDHLARAQQAARQACAAVGLARYRAGTDTIIIPLPVDDRIVASWSPTALPDPPEVAGQRVLQLAIVYEIVRLQLDRQYRWSERMNTCRDEDELRMWHALVEGRALHVTAQVADKLKSFVYADLLRQRYQSVPKDRPDPERLDMVRAMVFRDRLEACTQGKAFFEKIAASGMNPNVAFTTPPRQWLWMTRPELYVKASKNGLPDLRKVLGGLEGMPPAASWKSGQQALGPGMVREVAGMLHEQARAEVVLKNWEEGRTLVFFAPNGGGSMVVNLTRFETPAAARSYHGLSLDLQRKRDEIMNSNCTGSCKVLESRCESVEVPRSDAAVRCYKKVQYSDGRAVAADMVYVLAGSLVIEIDGFSTSVEPGWARQVVERITGAFAAPAAPVHAN